MTNRNSLLGRSRPVDRLSKAQRESSGKCGTGSRRRIAAGGSGSSHTSHQHWQAGGR